MDEPRMPAGCDFAVVGAGIVGLATARELLLRYPGAEVVVLEREAAIAAHQTGHSSGVIHAGIYYRPGSLKARLCVEGAARLYELSEERGIAARRNGKVIVATREGELPALEELARRGKANGVRGLRLVDAGELAEIEPYARGLRALHSPATGIVDFGAVATALAGEIRERGGSIRCRHAVRRLRPGGGALAIEHSSGRLLASRAVVCAGPGANWPAVAAGPPPEPRIVPFRGAYLKLRDERSELVRANIYPVPDPELPFLGMHLTRTPAGDVLLGPTALLAGARDAYRLRTVRPRDLAASLAWPGTWRMLRRFWRSGARELLHAISLRSALAEGRRLVPALAPGDVERSLHSGVRAQAVGRDGSLVDDFVIDETERALHVRNAPSPAATASLALASEIADRLERIA
jgi:(S)-2-hydroxyglutarate dehydrogenase